MRPKIEIGTTYPFFYEGRVVNAEVVSTHKVRTRNWWTVRLTESQRPIIRQSGPLAGWAVEFQTNTKSVADSIAYIESLPCFGPARQESFVVQWIDFGRLGLWAEVRDPAETSGTRPTQWTPSDYKTVEELIASGDANQVGAAT